MSFTVPDAIITAFFVGLITAMGFIFKYFLNKLTKNSEEKENRIFNELSKLTSKMESIYTMVMELRAEMPKNYTPKDDFNVWVSKEERTHRDIHDRIDKLYDKENK